MRKWTPETDQEADTLYRTFTEPQIRMRQDLCAQQIVMAHKQGNTDALLDLRAMEDALGREMLRRL